MVKSPADADTVSGEWRENGWIHNAYLSGRAVY